MSLKFHTLDLADFPRLPGWSLPAMALLLALALSPFVPANLVFVAGLASVLATGIGVAGLRRHGGPGVPSLPYYEASE